MNIKNIRAIAICFFMAIATFVYAADRPVIKPYTISGRALQKMSDNGLWALGWGAESEQLSPVLIDIAKNKSILLQTDSEIQTKGMCLAYDVTDDGNIVVGTYEAKPAYLNRTTGNWTKLPCTMVSGALHAVTPDGKFAVGTMANDDVSDVKYTNEKPAMWDLTTNKLVTPSDLPTIDPDGEKVSDYYVRLIGISPDGRYIMGQVLAYHYFTFIYDRESTEAIKWNYIGYNTTDGKTFTKRNDLIEISPVGMSPNGKWAVLDARVETQGDEFICSARYNLETKNLEIYSAKLDDMGMKGGCIDNDGNVYSATPDGSPIREFYVRSEGYWFSLRSILKQRYGMDFDLATGYTNTGTPLAVSSDGLTFISFADPQFGENYTMRMSERLVDICTELNLLNNYSISPKAGSIFTKLNQINVTFDREVEVIGQQTAATFGEWTSTSTNGIVLDPTDAKTVIVTFRSRTLEDGKTYTFTIPAGTICIKGDKTRKNEEITATYTGRANAPVKVVSIYPADGSVLAKIDNSSSPITIVMDNQVKTTSTASAALYTSDGKKVTSLTVAHQDNVVQLYPSTTQYLFAGEKYKVILEAGSVCDISGSGDNEQIVINYTGSYEREISTDNAILFESDFSNISASLATWMLYENDHRTPAEFPQSLEFDADNTPWNFSIRDDDDTNYCAASHSMYNPAGKSDDWMVMPQIYVPDKSTTLYFDAQSYKAAKTDVLKVVVWECDDVINTISQETFAKMSKEGKTIFEERLSPGKDENTLADDWTCYELDLAEFTGKNIYIAFVNQNNDQSMIFLDNVKVTRDMPYLLTLANKQAVVNETSVKISGKLTVSTESGFNGGFTLTLCDESGKEIDTFKYTTDKILPAGDVQSFAFENPLPLTIGEDNKFIIKVSYVEGGSTVKMTDEVKSSVMSLTFNPTKRVVLEEMTGTTCGNCPQGIIVIDKMKEMYGPQFIPISIHTYDGDAWGSGLKDYSSSLGLMAAPTAIVNRSTEPLMPMIQDPETFEYTMSYYGYLWMDKVAEELNDMTYIDVSATVDADESTGSFTLPMTVRSALNATNLNLNVFLVFMEDNLIGLQHNYFPTYDDPIFGEWGKGGRYAQSTVSGIVHNDVVRKVYGASYSGTSGLLPQSMDASVEYITDIKGELPGTYEKLENTKFAVILIDANTDKIVNACVAYVNPAAGIEEVQNKADNIKNNQTIVNLAGQKVGKNYKGIIIRGGKKYLLK
ncbi:MAG: choice-of-anchor J domain-containing protein [Bacteroidaceae bacterium]|nr:choice-of-anchor J domain-containing protein [Bacteroidaceae bacterium]